MVWVILDPWCTVKQIILASFWRSIKLLHIFFALVEKLWFLHNLKNNPFHNIGYDFLKTENSKDDVFESIISTRDPRHFHPTQSIDLFDPEKRCNSNLELNSENWSCLQISWLHFLYRLDNNLIIVIIKINKLL